MLSDRVSLGTFLWMAGLAAGALALAVAGQGCALLVCYDGDPGCAQASTGGGAGGGTGGIAVAGAGGSTFMTASSSGGTGGSTGGTGGSTGGTGGSTGGSGGTGGTPCAMGDPGNPVMCGASSTNCRGGDCCGGVCQPVVLPLPADRVGRYLTAAPGSAYIGMIDSPSSSSGQVTHVSAGTLEAFAANSSMLQDAKWTFSITEDPVPAHTTGGMVVTPFGEVLLSRSDSMNIMVLLRCAVGGGACTNFGNAAHAGLSIGTSDSAPLTLFATRAKGIALDLYDAANPGMTVATIPAPLGQPDASFGVSASGNFVAWSILGPNGCVALTGTTASTACDPVPCAAGNSDQPTGVALGAALGNGKIPVYFVTEPPDKEAELWRSELDPTGGCSVAPPVLMVTLNERLGRHAIALDDEAVYVVDAAAGAGAPNQQRVLACPRSQAGGTDADCEVVVDLGEPVRGLATGNGLVYFLSETHFGWRSQ